MNQMAPIARHSTEPLMGRGCADARLPASVLNLAGREREVATIVYERGAATARAVEASLSVKITNAAVRSMLQRLVRKGVLTREFGARGRRQSAVYMPAVTLDHVKDDAITTICRRYFDGSLLNVALRALDLLGEQPGFADQLQSRHEQRSAF
jgi:predicted transcriptional regulator